MNIALDYDDTYTKDPSLWDMLIMLARHGGHKVYVITWRYDNPVESSPVNAQLKTTVDGIIFTGRVAKQQVVKERGIEIDVWIDDNPWTILNSQVFNK